MRNVNRGEREFGRRFTWNGTEYPIRLFHVKHAIYEGGMVRPNGFHVKRGSLLGEWSVAFRVGRRRGGRCWRPHRH
jgi:hypothetical protein